MSNLPPEQMTARVVSDDWQVVEEALTFGRVNFPDGPARSALARLRERNENLERYRQDTDGALDRAQEECARLREREAQLACAEKDYEAMYDQAAKAEARVARLEEALRVIEAIPIPGSLLSTTARDLARRALSNEEEMFSGRLDEVEMLPPGVTVQEHYNRVAHEEEAETPCSICGTYGHFTHNHSEET